MQTKDDKKKELRKQIICAAKSYSSQLAGKVYLYVYGEEYFEVSFQTSQFKHLTGVVSVLSANSFYKKSKNGKLTVGQFGFDKDHLYSNAKIKVPCLCRLAELTNSTVCVLKDITTVTLTYKIGITNIDFTLCLTENIDKSGVKINNWLLPRSLRVKDKSVENSKDGKFIDFIFEKDASISSYTKLCYCDREKNIPNSISHLIDKSFYEKD